MPKVLVLIFLFACQIHGSIKLNSKLPKGISIREKTNLFLNKILVGRVNVISLTQYGFDVELVFKDNQEIPNNSYLVYFNNPIGEVFF